MQKTKVINATGSKITVKMSTGGIITKLLNGEVENGYFYTISIDPNATYREYWCAVPPGNNPQNKTIISSDDCGEYLEIKIMKDDTVSPPRYYWEGNKSRNPKSVASVEAKKAHGSSSTGASSTGQGSSPNIGTKALVSPRTNDPKFKCRIL